MIPQKLLKTNQPGYYKDTSSGAIINIDDNYYQQILAERQRLKEQQALCDEMQTLKGELTEIKSLLAQIVNGQKNG